MATSRPRRKASDGRDVRHIGSFRSGIWLNPSAAVGDKAAAEHKGIAMTHGISLLLALVLATSVCAHRADAGMSGASARFQKHRASQSQAALQPVEAAPRAKARPVKPAPARASLPRPAGTSLSDFDGTWKIIASPGCGLFGRSLVRVSRGRIVGLGLRGSVNPNGHVHTVSRSFGRSVVSTGSVRGSSGSGTYRVSTGCTGTWVGHRV